MFDIDGNPINPAIVVRGDRCETSNDDRSNHASTSSFLFSSSPNNNDNMNSRVASLEDNPIKKCASMKCNTTIPHPILLKSDSKTLLEIAKEDNPISTSGFESYYTSPLSQAPSHRQEKKSYLPTRIGAQNLGVLLNEKRPSLHSYDIGSSDTPSFVQDKSKGSMMSTATVASPIRDPKQQFLWDLSATYGITTCTVNTSTNNTEPTGRKSSNGVDMDNGNKYSPMQQQEQQCKNSLPPVASGSKVSHSSDPAVTFHTSSLPYGSNFGINNNTGSLWNLESQQQQMVNPLTSTGFIESESFREFQPGKEVSASQALMSKEHNPFQFHSNKVQQISELSIPNFLFPSYLNAITQPITTMDGGKVNSNDRIGNTDNRRSKGDAGDGSSRPYNCNVGRTRPLFLPCDGESLSEYQCLLRNQIELFEATEHDILSSTKGRNKPIFPGQVGVRCVHCRDIKPKYRPRGATYYPATLGAMYQSGQTMAIRHMRHHCKRIPYHVRDRLVMLKDEKSSAGGGKKYWSDAASVMGVYKCDGGGLRFHPSSVNKSTVPSDSNGKKTS